MQQRSERARRAAAVLGLSALAMLTGCATPVSGPTTIQALPSALKIDRSHVSQNQDSRVLYLILHYTEANFDHSMDILTTERPDRPPVSAHYLVRETPVEVYQLVDEGQRAWHAGPSYWKGASLLNSSSIGIEIVNSGPRREPAEPGDQDFVPFPEEQIQQVIQLCKEIVARHHIRPDRILGHSDIQPQSKQDPGPSFPWHRLAEAGLIPWPDAAQVAAAQPRFAAQLPDVGWFQDQLIAFGYGLERSGQLDHATRRVLSAFQMKYRPGRYDGLPDAQSAALLAVANTPGGMRMLSAGATP